MSSDLNGKNQKTLVIALGAVVVMVGLTYASVPLYSLFCKATGYGGEIRRVAANPGAVGTRIMTVRFNADTAPDLPWDFGPEQAPVKIKVGEDNLISYHATNNGKTPVTGTAVYNVTPEKAAKYFNKTQCFCFQEQTLQPGESAHFPVSFYVDPAISEDDNLDDVSTITLSYTFFRNDTQALEKATEKFYNPVTSTN